MSPKFPEQQKDKNNKRKNSPDSNEDTDNNEEQIFGLRRSPRKKMQRTDSDSLSQGASSVGDTPRPTPPAIGSRTPPVAEKVTWSREQDDMIAEFYRNNPMFWDQGDPNFSNKLLRGRRKKEFADEPLKEMLKYFVVA